MKKQIDNDFEKELRRLRLRRDLPKWVVNSVDQFMRNVGRVKSLVELYDTIQEIRSRNGRGKKGRRKVEEVDLLRSAVVLLHATLEEFLRAKVIQFFPYSQPDAFKSIPLFGLENNRADKFGLDSLVKHRDKTVDSLLRESVRSHAYQRSFNDGTDIMSWLERVGVRPDDELRKRLAKIGPMIKRRHSIVHNADLGSKSGKGNHRTSSLSRDTVDTWIGDTTAFMSRVLWHLGETLPSDNPDSSKYSGK